MILFELFQWIHPTRDDDTDMYVKSFWSRFFFFTVNHRGPLPLRELHSTDETIVWRDPGGSEPVYDLFTITSDFSLPQAVCDTDM